MATNNDHIPEEEEFPRLLRDLRSMPRVSAPSNLEYLLEQKIHGSRKEKTPWWKRFFVSGFEIGGWRIPAYAYGPVAAAVVVFIGLYVYRATNFDSQLEKVDKGQMIEQHQPAPKPENNAPAAVDKRERQNGTETAVPEPSRRESYTGEKQKAPATGMQPSVPPPSSAPRTAPSNVLKPAGEQPARQDEELMPKTRGLPDQFQSQPSQRKSETESRDSKIGGQQEGTTLENASQTNEKKLMDKEAKSSMQYNLIAKPSSLDSLRIKDSLRRLDSLRSLKKNR